MSEREQESGLPPRPASEYGPDTAASTSETPDLSDQALLQTLIELGEVDAEALAQLQASQAQQLASAQAELAGTTYLIDPRQASLSILEHFTGTVLGQHSLFSYQARLFEESSQAFEVEHWESWGSATCLLQARNGSIESFENADHSQYGLMLTAQGSYLYTPDLANSPRLKLAYQCQYQRVTPEENPLRVSAFDLYVAENLQYVCISDRYAGRLLLFETQGHQLLGEVAVRQAGSRKALNVAFDYYEARLFVTDGESARVLVVSLPELEVETLYETEHNQAFGALVQAPDIRYLYILSHQPQTQLNYFRLELSEIENQIPLKGVGFSSIQFDPCDLMALTPDQNHLLVVTSTNEPVMLTPAISVIDPHEGQPLRFQPIANALKEQTKPVGLAFPRPNPLYGLQQTALELALQKGLVTLEQLESKRQQLLAPPEELPEAAAELLAQLSPQAAEAISLSPGQAIPAIVSLLRNKFYLMHDLDLKEHPEALQALETAAEDYRQQLESQQAVEVKLPELLAGKGLDSLLTREAVVAEISQAYLRQYKIENPPPSCPSCRARLNGRWDCPSCFLEIESPTRRERKAASSLDSLGNLPRYQLLLADPERQRLLILDEHKTIDWELAYPELPTASPWQALWLNNQRLLLVDKLGHNVLECSPSGQVSWEIQQSDNPDLALFEPVKASFFTQDHEDQFLIVDQGQHRVLVVDRKFRILWQYGVKGEPGNSPGLLNSPSDLQRTFEGTYLIADTGNQRVIEVDGDQVVRSFGPEQGLQSPVFAQRLLDSDTLVVDAGQARILELDLDGELVSECLYYIEEMGPEMALEWPVQVFRREKQSLVLMDHSKILEIQPGTRQLLWSSLLEHLAKRVEILRDAFDKRDSYVQSFNQYRIPTLEELLERLREENRLASSAGIAQRIFDSLQHLIEERKALQESWEPTAQAKQINKMPLLTVPIFVIDRNYQQVVQIDRQGSPLWHFGTGDPKLMRPTHVFESPEGLYIADTHHHQVLEVNRQGEVLHIWGKPDVLLHPRSATPTRAGNVLVADQGHKRLVEFNAAGEIVWEFQKAREISYPYFALELNKGTILYVDWALHMVKEIDRQGELVWAYGQSSRRGAESNQLASPEFALRLPSGAILIADTGNDRVIEVSPRREILWEFRENKKHVLEKPNACFRFKDGHTLIIYNSYRQMLEINREGESCWSFTLGQVALV